MPTVATITSKGQVTIPKFIRQAMDLGRADRLVFTISADNLITLKPLKKSFLDYGGSVPPRNKPEDFHQVRSQTMKKVTQEIANSGR